MKYGCWAVFEANRSRSNVELIPVTGSLQSLLPMFGDLD